MKQHNKYKLTPQAHKHIVEQARIMPALQRLDKHGKPMSRQITKTVKGADLPEGTKTDDGKAPNPNKLYVQRGAEPLLVNHEVEMISAYYQGGQAAVQAYIARVEAIVARYNETEGKEAEND